MDKEMFSVLLRRGAQSNLALKVALIGGGKACYDLLILFNDEMLQPLNIEIIGVADLSLDAPGISLAHDMGIFTTAKFPDLYSLPGLNMIIELTGLTDVRDRMIRSKPIHISSIDNKGARLLWDLIQIKIEKQQLYNKMETVVQKERDWSQKVIDSLPDRIMVLNKDYTIYSVNKTFVKETGLSEEDVLGSFCYDVAESIFGICKGQKHECPFYNAFTYGEKFSVLHSHKDPDLKTIYKEIMVTPILDKNNNVTQVIEGIRDVTLRVTLERELRESENKLQQFFESAHDVIGIKDLSGRYLYVNPPATKATGLLKKNILGFKDHDVFSKNLADVISDHDREVLVRKKTMIFQEKMTLNKQTHYFHSVRFPIMDDQGEVISLAVISRDMTEEIVLQDEIRRNKEYVENILEHSSDMIITTGLEGEIVMFNQAAEQMLGYNKEEILNVSVERLWKNSDERHKLMEEVKKYGAVNNFPTTLISKDKKLIDISLSLSELRDSEGRILGTVGISKNVTEENRLRQKLIEQERLAAVGQTVAGVTHCMKNVLNALKGGAYMVNVALKRNNSDLMQEGWDNVSNGIERISKLSMEMLSYCRERKPVPILVDPLKLASEIVELTSKTARQEGIILICDGEKGPLMNLDPDTIERALLNLITNSLEACREKVYPSGDKPKVEVQVNRKKDMVIFAISDNGAGMDKDTLQKLFSSFFSTKASGGTGLGLCVTKKIVEEHSGQITVESSPGLGSTFTLIVPDLSHGSRTGNKS